MYNPLVSVIMPAYNTDAYIAEAIESILTQTFSNFEFIIINDGSTDNTLEVIRKYEAQDSRILVVSRENRGISVSLNEAIDLARGKYIARMDSDDICLPEKLEKQVAFMEAHPEIGVSGSWVKVFGNGANYIWQYPENDRRAKAGLIFGVVFPDPTFIVRKEILDKYNFRYDSSFDCSEDYHLWMRVASYTKFANIPEVLLLVRNSQTSTTKVQSSKALKVSGLINAIQLRKIGIAPTDTELNTHMSLRYNQFSEDKDFVRNVDSWLRKVIEQNKVYQYFPEPELTELLAERWFKTCNYATGHGWWTLKMFLTSATLKNHVKFERKVLIKFWLKCLIRREAGTKPTLMVRFAKKVTNLN